MKLKLIFISLLIFLSSCTNSFDEELYSISGRTMGTTFSVKFTTDKPIELSEIEKSINSVLERVNQQMSTYIPTSELSLFNKSKSTDWIDISSDLAFVCAEALQISKISNGKFDITIGPLVNLWGFGPDKKPIKIPSEKEIKTKLNSIGFNNVFVRKNPPAIKKSISNIYCDLSAIAKGFGVDKVSEYLSSKGIENYLVEVGGELRANGNKFGNKWKVGISKPVQKGGIEEVIELNNAAMATSGDYWNYFEENGVRYSHTIDPTTGKPINHKLASVTVIANSCMEADGLATAIDVMGPKDGYNFALDNNLTVYFIVRNGETFDIFFTPNFKSLIKKGI